MDIHLRDADGLAISMQEAWQTYPQMYNMPGIQENSCCIVVVDCQQGGGAGSQEGECSSCIATIPRE